MIGIGVCTCGWRGGVLGCVCHGLRAIGMTGERGDIRQAAVN